MFQYIIIHIKVEDNCWADLLSRCGSEKSEPTAAQIKHFGVAALFHDLVTPENDRDFPGRPLLRLQLRKGVLMSNRE